MLTDCSGLIPVAQVLCWLHTQAVLILPGNLWCWVGLMPQQQLLFPPTVGLATLAGMTPEIRVGRMHAICFPGWQSMWELSVHNRDGSGGGISQEEAVLRSGGGIQVIY